MVILSSLAKTDFFEHCAFYGGTCLRIFHGLDRYSEDLDFGLIREEDSFDIERYLPAVADGFRSFGLPMDIYHKKKSFETIVQSAMAQGNAHDILCELYPNDDDAKTIVFNQKVKVKFEVSPNILAGAGHEHLILDGLDKPDILCYDFPSLFAGKVGAVLTRQWGMRLKGRDFYDFAFYVRNEVPLNLTYLEAELKSSEHLASDVRFTKEVALDLLEKRFRSADYESGAADVRAFVRDLSFLQWWNADYFCSLLPRMHFQER